MCSLSLSVLYAYTHFLFPVTLWEDRKPCDQSLKDLIAGPRHQVLSCNAGSLGFIINSCSELYWSLRDRILSRSSVTSFTILAVTKIIVRSRSY